MPPTLRRLALLGFLVFGLGSARDDAREGRRAERAGDSLSAARAWRLVLEADPDHGRATRGLTQSGPEALRLRREAAARLVAAGRLQAAFEELDRAELLDQALLRLGVPSEPTSAQVRADLEAQAVAVLLARAEAAAAEADWARALGELALAEGAFPPSPALEARAAALWRSWAAELSASGQPRLAAERLARAAGHGDRAAAQEAAEALRALGREAREQGACRRASADLQAAEALAGDGSVSEELEGALTCARTWLGLEVRPAEAALSAVASDLDVRLRRALAEGASAHLLLTSTRGAGVPAPRLVPGPRGPETRQPATASLQLHRSRVRTGVASPVRRSERFLTPGGEAQVSWLEHVQPLAVSLSATLRVDAGASDRVALVPLEIEVGGEARWYSGVVLATTGRSIDPWQPQVTGVSFTSEFKKRSQASEQRRQAEEAVGAAAREALARAAARAILERVDGEPAPESWPAAAPAPQ